MERDGDGKDHRIDPGDDDFLISGSADIQDLKFDEEFKKKINPDLIEDERIEFEDINAIQTNDFYLKLKDMHDSIKYNVPILIINSDNTFKTKSVEIVSQKLKLELIKVDMSKEITVKDLIARYSEKEDSWPGISMEDGPLLRAFRDGKILLLNEIDKAQPSVLHFLEIALDNEFLNVDLPHQLSERKNKDFRLIITLNVDSYRSILGQEQFYRRFKVIQNFSEDNVEKTCLFYADKYNYENKEIVQKLIEFHATLQSEFGKEKFTYRDILYTLRALSKGENICETILTNYGARFYEEGEKRKFNEIFDKFPEFNEKTDEDELPKFQNCYFNDSLRSALNSLTLLLQNKQNVLIVGEKGCGKTQLALWSSEDYNKVLRKKDGLHDHEETPLLFMCTQNSKITDLIGGNSSMKKSKNNDIEFWQKGFLPIHIKQGSCCVLDSIDQSPSLILRLSGLLDNEETFEIPESSSCPRLTIHKNFRIIATCNKDNLKSLDQNILNKFTIIFLDNQIKDISENNFKEMIKIMIKKYKFNLSRKITYLRKHGKTGDEGDMKDILIFKKADDAPKDEDDMKDEEYPMNAFYERLKNKNISFISRIC